MFVKHDIIAWYTMMAEPMNTLKKHYPMIQIFTEYPTWYKHSPNRPCINRGNAGEKWDILWFTTRMRWIIIISALSGVSDRILPFYPIPHISVFNVSSSAPSEIRRPISSIIYMHCNVTINSPRKKKKTQKSSRRSTIKSKISSFR